MSTVKEMQDAGQGGPPGGLGSDEDFNACFDKVDEDRSGFISRQEMLKFIKTVAGLWSILNDKKG